jgi:arabinose-5-phosphate isomerase
VRKPAQRSHAGPTSAPPAAKQLVDRGKRVLALEAAAVQRLADTLGPAFARAIEILAAASGRVIVSGVGKSGLIARKIAATFTSTGTPASFLHPVDSLHGDLGIVTRNDVALMISKSGASDELFGLMGQLKRLGVPIIAMTGDADSPLGRQATVVLDASVAEEACPETLAPTASTTVALALGDALAVTLLEVKGFRREDFAALHPGGVLGRKLLLRVADVMLTADLPVLTPDRPMRECVVLLAQKRGTVAIVDGANGSLVGVVTAGDLTRLMERNDGFLDVRVGDVMTRTPKVTTPEELAGAAVSLMERHGIMALPVLDENHRVVGIVHLHDLMKAGAV